MDNRPDEVPPFSPVATKIFIILGLTLGLMIPLYQVQNQIEARRDYETVAQRDVANGWGLDVHIGSPVLSQLNKLAHPELSETRIRIESNEKKRGLFEVPVYTSTFTSTVSFPQSVTPGKLTFPVTPTASIQTYKIRDVKSGVELKSVLIDGGIRVLPTVGTNQVEIEVVMRGTGPLVYSSKAEEDQVVMVGNWTKPKYMDVILPASSKLSGKGFEARWTLHSLAKMDTSDRDVKSIGLTHLWVKTDYTMIERAVKYGILFIALTFALVFVVEFVSKAKIHPLQYTMIGLAISLFYLLLLAISESTGFDIAYAVSTLLVTSLIAFYVHGFVRARKFVWMILAQQLTLSGFFYLLLSLEEAAFLIGTLGLFTTLAAFMTLTRKFDWYNGAIGVES